MPPLPVGPGASIRAHRCPLAAASGRLRRPQAEIEASEVSIGDAYDNALAETVIGLFKTEVIRLRGPWHHVEHVEFATLEGVD